MLPRIIPMRLRIGREAFDDPAYLFELKHDGFRAIAYIEHAECRLVSRNMRNLRYDSLQKALAKLPIKDVIFDGEIVCLDDRGVSQFNQLLNRKAEPVFYAFDLLWHDGEDLTQRPLIERKTECAELLRHRNAAVCFTRSISESMERDSSRQFAR
jgi:bifunctional non-homologous end joining protein LigD